MPGQPKDRYVEPLYVGTEVVGRHRITRYGLKPDEREHRGVVDQLGRDRAGRWWVRVRCEDGETRLFEDRAVEPVPLREETRAG